MAEDALVLEGADKTEAAVRSHGRGDLLRTVWGYSHLPNTRTVDNHIARLRKKVEVAPENPRFIHTVHGHGYRFDGEPAADSP